MTDYTELRRLATKAAAARGRGTFGLYDFDAFVRVCEPETVIELVDTIDAFAKAQMKAGDNAATLHAEIEEQAWEQALLADHNAVLEAERDEARTAVKMLAEALAVYDVNGELWPRARAALADPVVKKIIEGGEQP